jgi:hypothetical protein
MSGATATPLLLEQTELSSLSDSCEGGQVDACLALAQAASSAYARSVWGQARGTDTIDHRRFHAMRAYQPLACHHGSEAMCGVSGGLKRSLTYSDTSLRVYLVDEAGIPVVGVPYQWRVASSVVAGPI